MAGVPSEPTGSSESTSESTSESIGGSTKTEVVRNDLEHRYEIWHGSHLAGFAAYREHGTRTIFTHTEIGEEFGGKGLGGVLAENAIEDTVSRGHTIVPICPFIAAWLRKHPDYEEHVSWPASEHDTAAGEA